MNSLFYVKEIKDIEDINYDGDFEEIKEYNFRRAALRWAWRKTDEKRERLIKDGCLLMAKDRNGHSKFFVVDGEMTIYYDANEISKEKMIETIKEVYGG